MLSYYDLTIDRHDIERLQRRRPRRRHRRRSRSSSANSSDGKRSVSTRVLKIRTKWLELLLSHRKSWEIRSRTCAVGPVLLFEVGAKRIVGRADIVNVFPLSHSELGRYFDKHCVDNTALEELGYANPHVWELANVKRFNIPIPHDGGRHMVTWGRPYAGVIPD